MNVQITIKSEKSEQSGQKHRSSNNFTTADFPQSATLNFLVYYRYGQIDQVNAPNVLFDIKVDKTGHDPTYLHNVKSGDSHKNTRHRNLYIANPRNAEEAFTVVIK